MLLQIGVAPLLLALRRAYCRARVFVKAKHIEKSEKYHKTSHGIYHKPQHGTLASKS